MRIKGEVANLELPKPPVPSVVRSSFVPERPDPTPSPTQPNLADECDGADDVMGEVDEVEVEGELSESGTHTLTSDDCSVGRLGRIVIDVYEGKFDVDFEGAIDGGRLDLAWRSMMRQYRVWKHSQYKKLEEDKKKEE